MKITVFFKLFAAVIFFNHVGDAFLSELEGDVEGLESDSNSPMTDDQIDILLKSEIEANRLVIKEKNGDNPAKVATGERLSLILDFNRDNIFKNFLGRWVNGEQVIIEATTVDQTDLEDDKKKNLVSCALSLTTKKVEESKSEAAPPKKKASAK